MAELGCNADGRAAIPPASLAAIYAAWTRCVAYPDANITDWIHGCHDRGVRVLLVLASESIGQDPSQWSKRITTYRDRYEGLIDAWQVGNESDHVSPSSWTMTQGDLSTLLQTARAALGSAAYIVGAGMASGNPSWATGVDWEPASAIACHPYAKEPHTAPLNTLLSGYKALGKPLWVTEYHARTLGMAAALRDDDRLEVALAFCYTDRMVPGFGMIEDYRALDDFRTAAAPQAPKPPIERHAEYVLGFRKWWLREPALLGIPLKNERNVAPEWQIQPTENGVLSWVGGKGHAFVTHEGRVFRWEESWPKSREVPA